ncbi:hypothetical protein Tco_0639546, partial [Tanacetum coccineum]
VKRILLDVKLAGLLADLRSSFEDSFFRDYIIGIMPLRRKTRSAGRSTVAPRGGRMGGRTSRGGGRTGEPTDRVGRRTSDQDVQGGDRGNRLNGGVDEVPDFSTVIAP